MPTCKPAYGLTGHPDTRRTGQTAHRPIRLSERQPHTRLTRHCHRAARPGTSRRAPGPRPPAVAGAQGLGCPALRLVSDPEWPARAPCGAVQDPAETVARPSRQSPAASTRPTCPRGRPRPTQASRARSQTCSHPRPPAAGPAPAPRRRDPRPPPPSIARAPRPGQPRPGAGADDHARSDTSPRPEPDQRHSPLQGGWGGQWFWGSGVPYPRAR